MKAPLLLSLLAGIYLSGMTGLLQTVSRSGSAVNAETRENTEAVNHVSGSNASHGQVADRRGSEAAAADAETGQMALLAPPSQPEADAAGMVQEFFRPTGTVFTHLKLHGVEGEKVTIEVFDITGKLVLTREGVMDSADSDFLLNFSHAMDGVYFVRATAGNKQTSVKYVKQSIG